MNRKYICICCILICVAGALFSLKIVLETSSSHMKSGDSGYTVVVDGGHGGMDPGKVGVGQVMEKDVNLAIANLVKGYLEENRIHVVMTRTTDTMLGDTSASNRKQEDLRARIQVIEETAPDLVVSIHQNSFEQASSKGAQVFYYDGSQKGKELAEQLQAELISSLDSSNHRKAKANQSYYLLKKSAYTTVIVECGFLSNSEEAQKLSSREYQDQVAKAIAVGIIKYLGGGES
ncbi:MAG: N-acetylmuramoyl-L-alanine amidase [Clostridiales bacterium]|nr:N-acetylmuramoyl-L-alanine amidase [Clostridiales bacterium]